MQVWQNEQGDRLFVYDLFKLTDVEYRKRYKNGCIVVADILRKLHLHFNHLDDVRLWMKENGYELQEE